MEFRGVVFGSTSPTIPGAARSIKAEGLRPVIDVIERAAPGMVELVGSPDRPGFEIRLPHREFPKAYEPHLRRAAAAPLSGGGKREPVQVPDPPSRPPASAPALCPPLLDPVPPLLP